MSMNEYEKAKASLAMPHEKYAAMDGAEPQTAHEQKNLRDITTKEELITFLQAVYHEKEPNIYRCRWDPYNEKEVVLWYKGDCKIVAGSVVEVLRSLPVKKTSLLGRIKAFILNLITNDDYA